MVLTLFQSQITLSAPHSLCKDTKGTSILPPDHVESALVKHDMPALHWLSGVLISM